MRLVVCVDRDDDLGRKAGVVGPVVGRENVLAAALKLGTADPEDADTNAMFAAIHLLDQLREAGEEADVVVLTGSPKVGVLSDRRVADQFDRVLREKPASSAHLVSDGAEDEFLFPILASRVRIDGVRRVYIRQSASLESTYYTLVRALKDPKLRAKTVLPLAIVLLILGIAAASGVIWWGVIGLSILLGIYLIFWTFDIDESIIDSIRSASTDVRQGAVAFGFGLTAIALVGVGFLTGYNVYVGHPSDTPIDRVVRFAATGILFWLFAAEIWESGRAIRQYLLRGHFPRSYPVATISIVGMGFVSYGIVYAAALIENLPLTGAFGSAQLPLIITLIVGGLTLVIGASAFYQYRKVRSTPALPGDPVDNSDDLPSAGDSG